MRNQNRTTPAVSFAILSSILALVFMSADRFYVAAPGLACVIMVLWLWMKLWDRDKKIPFFDVGVFCALAALVYTVYPLVNYWVGGLQFGPLSDNRLAVYNPSPAEMGVFHLRHVLYLFSFVFFYSTFRGKGTLEVDNVSTPGRSTRQIIFIIFLLFTGYFFFLQLTTGVNYNPSYESEAYADYIAALASLPLLLLQISGKLAGLLFVFKVALLFIVISRCRQKRWRNILLIWVAAEIVQTVYIKGARTGLVLFLMAAALLYHRLIRPFTMKYLVSAGAMLLVVFIFMGVYRSHFNIAEMRNDLARGSGGIFSTGNEFTTLLGTAYDVHQLKESGLYLPWYLYINDFINILPPQQIMPFEKIPASEWYLREIGQSGTGQGFMWGVISQSIVGWDWLELVLRGAILGYILARIHRWYIKHQAEFLGTLFYTFLCVKVYYTFRDTTFSLLANLVWEIIPFYLLLCIGAAIFSRKVADQPNHRIALSAHI